MTGTVFTTDSERGGRGAARVAGRYLIEEQLGKGGMGVVYRALDEVAGRRVAFKQLSRAVRPERRRALEALFEREYYTLVRIKHPRIIEVYDYGVTEAGPYYTMELLDGQDLQQRTPVPPAELCRHLRDIASSLALIHAHRLVHRDLSPRNIRFTQEGRAKLIDFGALCPFGLSTDLVGTAPFTAPESVFGMSLDQRADLYGLGAVAYYALTGRAAYPARQLSDLLELWATPAAPPSHFVSDVPPELDALVLALLSPDPVSRPASAAVVIDQLTAIAGLEPEEHEHGAQSYLSSSGFVGRELELECIAEGVERLLAGEGSETLVEGSTGTGKTRLLQEACLRAQLRGASVVRADAQLTPGSFGCVAALGLQLLAVCPEIALGAAEPYGAILGHIDHELWERLGRPELKLLVPNPGERRATLRTAFHEWFSSVAAQRPLLLCVDNLQLADDNSAAFLAALGHVARERALMLLLGQRLGERVIARPPVAALRRRSARLKLGTLSAAACEELARSLFGDVPNMPRVGRLLYEKSAGNPQQFMDLVQLLVRSQAIEYVGGTWVLPLEILHDQLPAGRDELIAARIAALSPHARRLAESLSVQGKPVAIEHLRSLLDTHTDAAFHGALDELVAEQIVVADAGKYRFAQAGLRTALTSRMNEAEKRSAHTRAALALLDAAGPTLTARIEAGWHFLHAGAEERGADLLASAGRAYLAASVGSEGSEQAVHALIGALDIYTKHQRSKHQLGRVLFPLLPLAYFNDWRLVVEYADRALALGLDITGLARARKLRPYLGRKAALMAGLSSAALGFSREQKRGLDYELRDAVGLFCSTMPSVSGVYGTMLDTDRLVRLHDALEPLGYFGEHELPKLMYDYVGCVLALNQGRRGTLGRLEDLMARFQAPAIRKRLGEGHWRSMYGGHLFQAGMLEANGFGSGALERARQMDELGVRVWSMVADSLRLLHYAMRGESERMREYAARVELFAVQGSTTWQTEMFFPLVMLNIQISCEDALGVRRSWEQLSRLAVAVPALQVHADTAQAAYRLLRGDLEQAIANYEGLLPRLPVARSANWLPVRWAFARALNQAGQFERARALMLSLIESGELEPRLMAQYGEPYRQLALAESGLGQHATAARLLDRLLADYGAQDQPLFVGLLHRTRAEVALAAGDQAAYEHHFALMDQLLRSTRNPAVAAQCERLAARGGYGSVRSALDPTSSSWPAAGPASRPPRSSETASSLRTLSSASDPSVEALALVMRRARARAAYLYVRDSSGLRLSSASPERGPSPRLEQMLKELIERAHFEAAAAEHEAATVLEPTYDSCGVLLAGDAAETARTELARSETATVFTPAHGSDTCDGDDHHLLTLRVRDGARTRVVGGVILHMDPQDHARLEPEFLESLAALLDARLSGASTVAQA